LPFLEVRKSISREAASYTTSAAVVEKGRFSM
jgi:hypothetical protein